MFELDHMKFENERKNGELEKVSKKKKEKRREKGTTSSCLVGRPLC
jgi:hypothetical protein